MKKVVFILIALQFALYSCKKQDEEQKGENHCIYGKWKLFKTADAEGGGYVDNNYESYLYLNEDFTYKETYGNIIITGNLVLINDTIKLTQHYSSNNNGYDNTTITYKYRLYDNKLKLNVIEPLVWTSALLYERD